MEIEELKIKMEIRGLKAENAYLRMKVNDIEQQLNKLSDSMLFLGSTMANTLMNIGIGEK